MTVQTEPTELPRYSYGGDEFVFVEIDEAMSLEANFRAMSITKALREQDIAGVTEIVPSNASYMVRINPDEIHPDAMIDKLRELDAQAEATELRLSTRVVDVPVMYDDPWTRETLLRFRDRHQDPDATDLEYAARINGYDDVEGFVAAHSGAPYLVSMVGFVPGLPWCFQMVPRERQLEVPKYVRPRTDTPELAFGHGGAFAVVYPVQGAGGYQLFGMAAAPIYDLAQRLPDFAESIVFPRPGDIFRYRRIERDEFDDIRARVEEGTFSYRVRDWDFDANEFLADPDSYTERILGVLYGD